MREIRIPGIRRVLRVSWSDPAMRRDIDDEIRFHLDARTDELIRLGASAQDARERARAEYGDVEQSRRELAQVDRHRRGHERREEFLMSFFDDLRYSARALLRRPTLLAVTTLTLAIGIAANAVMFGVVDQLMLRPPAHVVAPDDVKRIYFRDVADGSPRYGPVTTYPVVTALRKNVTAFSEVAAFGRENDYSLGRGPDARSVKVLLVSANFFRLLGVKPILGLGFNDDHDRVPQADRVVMVSHGFWQQFLGGDENVIGRQLPLQGQSFTIVGVAPRGFAGIDMQRVDIWIPVASVGMTVMGEGWHDKTNNWWARIIGRVRTGGSSEVAEAQATSAYRALVKEWKDRSRDSTGSIVLSSIIGTRRPNGVSRESKISLWLMGVSAIVLLIACANVANLLIARTMERRREISVRLALGVSRGRLLRMLLTEAALLAALGSLAALIIAAAASQFVQRVLLPDIVWAETVIDARVFGFTLGVTVLCVFLAGLAPALHGMGTRVSEGLKASARQVAGGRNAVRFGLMMTQAALSVLLLVGAGLFVKSLRNVVTRDVGIDRERVLQVTMPLERFGFDTVQITDIYRRGQERLAALPGVENVSVLRLTVPMWSASAMSFSVPGVPYVQIKGGGPYNAVIPAGFFRTLGATMIRGREFTPAEETTPSRVAIVNDVLARAYWPGQDPIGKCVKLGDKDPCSTIVGVSKNVLQFGLVNDDRALVYAPPSHPSYPDELPSAMLVRVSGDPDIVVPMVRKELQALAPTMPFVQVKQYSELVAGQLRQWKLGATMFTLFGVIALIIAAVGLYSVMAYWVSQRTHEIGVRMALGAQRWDVVRLVALQSSRAVISGLVVGGIAAVIASRWVAGMLYETSPRDPVVYATAALVLALAAAVASIVPARRSAAVDPAQAIRTD